ncbi:hypothetical protein L6164_030263 [Bauhinia variegata]|uniref:Uncharacterized protein n=1 Tax=Bauhinia variegata TaxID=167791 RepID=A0ACB9LC54_BAUVA|nr:hypothetical protein L6164_030263 [Bauhinia variegata]
MAIGTIYAAVPAVAATAAAAGYYFFDRSYVKELRRGISASNQRMIAKVKEQVMMLHEPKMAPELDGLHCFETLVVH